jgi:hypothetical protein
VMVVVAGLCVGAPAMGQMVTPPPAQTPAPDAHIPKLPPPPPTSLPQRLTPEQMAAARPVAAAKPQSPKAGWPKPADLPKLEYAKLVDSTGAAVALDEPPELAALKRNPTLPAGFLDKPEVAAFMKDRRAVLERMCIDMLDLCEKVEGGYVEQADLSEKDNKAVLASLTATLKPLSIGSSGTIDSISVEMFKKDLITGEQASFNDMIVGEYNRAAFRAPSTQDLMKIVLKAPTLETMWVYRNLQAEAAGVMEKAVEGLEMDSSLKDAAVESAKSYAPGLDMDQKVKIYRDATAGMTVEQRQRVLRRVVELRSN